MANPDVSATHCQTEADDKVVSKQEVLERAARLGVLTKLKHGSVVSVEQLAESLSGSGGAYYDPTVSSQLEEVMVGLTKVGLCSEVEVAQDGNKQYRVSNLKAMTQHLSSNRSATKPDVSPKQEAAPPSPVATQCASQPQQQQPIPIPNAPQMPVAGGVPYPVYMYPMGLSQSPTVGYMPQPPMHAPWPGGNWESAMRAMGIRPGAAGLMPFSPGEFPPMLQQPGLVPTGWGGLSLQSPINVVGGPPAQLPPGARPPVNYVRPPVTAHSGTGADISQSDAKSQPTASSSAKEGKDDSAPRHDSSDSPRKPEPVSKRQPCAFFLKTGTCAYGDKCKFHHPLDKVPVVQFNSLGLPIRPAEPECAYYMKNLKCGFGVSCKFNHPEPVFFYIPSQGSPASSMLQGSPDLMRLQVPLSASPMSMPGLPSMPLAPTSIGQPLRGAPKQPMEAAKRTAGEPGTTAAQGERKDTKGSDGQLNTQNYRRKQVSTNT